MKISREKYTALLPLIRSTPGFYEEKVLPNSYTQKFSFQSGFACCISRNNKNTDLSVHFENEGVDSVAHLAILTAIQ
ncbi:hypothetical protein D3C75_473510 [compost metagenome]